MLVLKRRNAEGLVIGESIKVTVLEIRGNYVRLGFEAPIEVSILRVAAGETPKQRKDDERS